MADTTHYKLQFFACDKDMIFDLLLGDVLDMLKDCDSEYTFNAGSEDHPVIIQCYEYYERTGENECFLMNTIADMLLPVTLSDDGGFCEAEPLVRHARIREDGTLFRIEHNPACEDMISTKKVIEAYMLGQMESLIETINKNDNSWATQMAILKKLGRK